MRCLSGAAFYGNAFHTPLVALRMSSNSRGREKGCSMKNPEIQKWKKLKFRQDMGGNGGLEGELRVEEERLGHKPIRGSIAKGKAGLFFPSPQTNIAKCKERRQLIQDELRAGLEAR